MMSLGMEMANAEGLPEMEFDRLGEFLKNHKAALNIEEVDGFFAALIAGPELVPPSEYLPEVFGGEMSNIFAGIDEANEIMGLLMRHWNAIANTLHRGDVYLPVLLEDEDGVCKGNDWSHGFVHGMEMRKAGWGELIADEEHYGCLVAVMALYHEHDEDPELRPGPISPEQREEILVQMAAGIVRAYRYFRSNQPSAGRAGPVEPHGAPGKFGRNDPCPCGSGKKYKRCCGGATIN
jgi:uncharacterized protein